jgi:hypothetical protein
VGTRSDWHQTVTTIAGTISVLLIAVGLYFTAAANRDTNAATLKQEHLTEQGQVTDRFGRAIDLLGSNELDVRVGGVYALERLMHDSPADEPNIIEVLSAFIRDHTPESITARSNATTSPCRSHTTTSKRRPAHPSDDAQAALTVLGRRPVLAGSHLHIDLTWADIAGASLLHANLTGADLRCAGLTGAYLIGASLRDASLRWACLIGVDLTGADLTGADLTSADLTGANWPSDTPVPHGWARDPDSGLLKRASEQTSSAP